MIRPLTNTIRSTSMWPYTEEENNYISEQKKPKSDWDYDTYGHGA